MAASSSPVIVFLLAFGAIAEVLLPNGRPGCKGPPEACPDLRDDTVQLQIRQAAAGDGGHASRANKTLRQSLADCLRQDLDASNVIEPGSNAYSTAKIMVNDWSDTAAGVETQLKPEPVMIAKVANLAETRAAVKCAAKAGVQACARSGQHGWDNKGGCNDGLLVDVTEIKVVNINATTKTALLGAGNWLGRIYNRLALQNGAGLTVPMGTVSCVGTGLIPGCGRGLFTTTHGLACDSIIKVHYVDGNGASGTASATQNPDMLWMARGGGGEFPGIITHIQMQAFDAPGTVWTTMCEFKAFDQVKSAMKEWFAQNPAMLDPARKVYTTLTLFNSGVARVKIFCNGCSQDEKDWAQSPLDKINEKAGLTGQCSETERSWLDQVVYESGGPSSARTSWLLNRENGWGKMNDPSSRGPSTANGRVGDSWDVPDSIIDAIASRCMNGPGEPWAMFCGIYPISGPKVTGASATAYGSRDALWSLHWKYGMLKGQGADYYNHFKQESRDFQRDLDKWMPCRNFYNYVDTDGMECNGGESRRGSTEWLQAYFSNVTRMREIKAAADPNNVIRSACDEARNSGSARSGQRVPSPTRT